MKRLLPLLLLPVAVWATETASPWMAGHPRLLFTKAEEPAVRALAARDPLARRLAEYLRAEADRYAAAPQEPYALDGNGALLWTSRRYVRRLGTLALMYRMTGEKAYLEAADAALRHVCAFRDWHPAHFLDTAEMTAAVAIAYDWLHDALPEETKARARRAICEKGLRHALDEYARGGPNGWARRDTNWNVVCNGGMVLGALAVAEDCPQEARTVLAQAARHMPNCLRHFAPDGVCYEGPAYWGYTHRYLAMYLKAVRDNGGDTAGIGALPGIARTARFFIRTQTPSGHPFAFGDATLRQEAFDGPALFLYGRLFRQPDVSAWYRRRLARELRGTPGFEQTFFLALPWFDAAPDAAVPEPPALEAFRNRHNDILALRGDGAAPGALCLLAKGGRPNAAHQHMDCGSFMLEADGVLWVEDLGADDYGLPGFWDGREGGARWRYFRTGNHAHSTLSIDGALQSAKGHAFLRETRPDAPAPSATFDLSESYGRHAHSTLRTFALIDDTTLEIRDALRLRDPASRVTWQAVTRAQVAVDGNVATLSKDGKRLTLTLLEPQGATFRAEPPPAPLSPREKPNDGVTLLRATCALPQGEGVIRVRLSAGVGRPPRP